MQSHYGFIYSTSFGKLLKTPFKFKGQFIVYSHEDNYPKKNEVESFLRNHYSSIPYSHVLVCRTIKPYGSAGDFVIPSRNNMMRFLNILRVIKPNNSFLKFEAFHTGIQFQSSTLHESDEIPHFLSMKKDIDIRQVHIDLLKKCLNSIGRLKLIQKHRVNNFYGYLEYSVKGPINHRLIWIYISFESLFKLLEERGRFEKNICRRAAFFLESKNSFKRQKIYGFLDKGYDLRNKLVHGALVNDKEVNKTLIKLESIIWRVGYLLLTTNKKWLKLFSSDDLELKKYFESLNKQNF